MPSTDLHTNPSTAYAPSLEVYTIVGFSQAEASSGPSHSGF